MEAARSIVHPENIFDYSVENGKIKVVSNEKKPPTPEEIEDPKSPLIKGRRNQLYESSEEEVKKPKTPPVIYSEK